MPAKKKPASVHRLNGTYRESDHATGVDLPAAIPDMPEWLSVPARVEWRRVCDVLKDAGYLAKTDFMSLAVYCELAADFASNPVEFSAGKLGQLRLLMSELGLTPSARAKMPTPKKENSNPFGKLAK